MSLINKAITAVMIMASLVIAELPLEQMKGQHGMIVPQHRAKFSSVFHYAILNHNVIANVRFWSQFWAPNNIQPVFYKPDREQDIKIDSAQDWVCAFIQLCYPSPGLRVLGGPTDPKDVATRLEQKHIGRMQDIIGAYKTDGSNKYLLAGMLLQSLHDLKDATGKVPTTTAFKKMYDDAMQQLVQQYQDNPSEYQALDDQEIMHSVFKSIGKKLLETKDFKDYHYRHYPEDFIRILMYALEESYQVDRYPLYIVEYVLGSLALYKAEDKRQLLEMYWHMPHLSYPELFDKKGQYLQLPTYTLNFSKEEYFDLKSNIGDNGLQNKIFSSPELMLFAGAGYDEYENVLPKLIMYGSTFYPHAGENIKYSDCGGTAVLNLLKAFIYDNTTNTFVTHKLEELAKAAGLEPYASGGSIVIDRNNYSKSNPFKIDTNDEPILALIKFFKYYNNKNAALTKEARDNWSLVLSARAGVAYRKSAVCEIDAGISNVMELLKTLLPGLAYTPWASETLDKYKINSETLSNITEHFSTAQKKIDWSIAYIGDHKLPNKEFMDIRFKIKNNELKMHFTKRHFELFYTTPPPNKWQNTLPAQKWRALLDSIMFKDNKMHWLNLFSFFNANTAKPHDYWLEMSKIFADQSEEELAKIKSDFARHFVYSYTDLWQVSPEQLSLITLREFIHDSMNSAYDIADTFWAKKLGSMPQADDNTITEVLRFYGLYSNIINIKSVYLKQFYDHYREYIQQNLDKIDSYFWYNIASRQNSNFYTHALRMLGYDERERYGTYSKSQHTERINRAIKHFADRTEEEEYYKFLMENIKNGGKIVNELYDSANIDGKDWMRRVGYAPPAKVGG